MKHPKLQSLLISTLLSFFLGFGATGCMVTGLKLDVPLVLLGFFCLLLSLVLSAIFCSRHSGKILLGITVAFLILLVPQKVFRQQLYSMLYEILFFYHSGYGIPIPAFLQNIQPTMHLLPLRPALRYRLHFLHFPGYSDSSGSSDSVASASVQDLSETQLPSYFLLQTYPCPYP